MSSINPLRRAAALGAACVALAVFLALPSLTDGFNRSSAEATLWQFMNGARVNNGLAPLQQHGTLVSLARWRRQDMLDRNYFSHTIPGCGCDVYVYYDSNGVAWDWAGENLAWNSGLADQDSPVRRHERLMASPGHRANILDPRFTYGGIGAASADNQLFAGYVQNTRIYTQLFLQPKGAAPATAPAPQAPTPGDGNGGGGGGQTSPQQPAPTPAPAPEPALMEMDPPARPHSDKIDGISEPVVSRRWPAIYRGLFRPI